MILGFVKFAVPMAIADAPAIINSSAVEVFVIPPIPTIGIVSCWLTCQTIFNAIGRIAGPDRPEVKVPVVDRFVLLSIPIAPRVLINEIAVEPDDSAAIAKSVIVWS